MVANSAGAGGSGAQTAGRWARFQIAKMANGQVMVAFLEQSMCPPLPFYPSPRQDLPTPQSTLAKVCTLKVLGKGKCIPQGEDQRDSLGSFIFD